MGSIGTCNVWHQLYIQDQFAYIISIIKTKTIFLWILVESLDQLCLNAEGIPSQEGTSPPSSTSSNAYNHRAELYICDVTML
jgi:hypothetical protein